jgi:hypothetical protein
MSVSALANLAVADLSNSTKTCARIGYNDGIPQRLHQNCMPAFKEQFMTDWLMTMVLFLP